MKKQFDQFLQELLASGFFTESCSLNGEQLEADAAKRCLLQAMMLLDQKYGAGSEKLDFTGMSVAEYAQCMEEGSTDKQKNLLCSAVEYVTAAFPVQNEQLKEENLPILLYLADCAEDMGISPVHFRQWWHHFTEEELEGRKAVMTASFYVFFSCY